MVGDFATGSDFEIYLLVYFTADLLRKSPTLTLRFINWVVVICDGDHVYWILLRLDW